ncbi:hypothetical protein ACU610_05230 [Geodermatophilus sp. URMC 61]|uniref:hypothetical protein n=1 Tax=Geodermatophilus sp. URMC 61 TaxID=3423411 RepID=UPI00406C5D4D
MRDDELRARLSALADATAPPPRADLTAVVEQRHRARRRTQLRLGAVGLAVVAAVAGGRLLVPDGPSAEPATAVADAPASAPLADAGAGGSRTVGSLAGDAAFVAAARQLSWGDAGAGAAGPPQDAQVLFAGDVPGGRWALVSRPLTVPPPLVDDDELERQLGTGSVALAWFAGPPGAAPDELRLRSAPVVVERVLPAALWDPGTGTLAVVAPSSAVTARVVDDSGTPLAEVPLTDGLGGTAGPAATARVEVRAADGTVLSSVEPIRADR